MFDSAVPQMPEPTRARYPDEQEYAERAGVPLAMIDDAAHVPRPKAGPRDLALRDFADSCRASETVPSNQRSYT